MNEEQELPAAEDRDFVVAEDLEQSDRPDWLPEKYNSGEDLAKAYKELETKLGSNAEELKSQFMKEVEEEAFKDRPENVGDYELPEIIDQDAATDNQLLQWWSNHAFENGFSQEEFEKGIQVYAESQDQGPDIEAEAEKLGENANDRISAASMFANKFFPPESMPAIERMCESHEGILALEHMMETLKDGNFSGDTAPTSGLSEADLRTMMNDPRYWKERDPAYVDKVTKGFQQLR